jgi:GNAT superfamily N-acetyltransferase
VANIAEGFASWIAWAPVGWTPPVTMPADPADISRLAERLAQPEVWCLIALDGAHVAGHVGIAPTTREDPAPAPAGTTNLWQLFVRRPWRGTEVGRELMAAAAAEAGRRGFQTMRLWTPKGAGRARRFYEREGWTLTDAVHENTPIGLPTVQYSRRCDAAG